MRYRDCMIAWMPMKAKPMGRYAAPGSICVGPHPDKDRWSRPYRSTVGGCILVVKRWSLLRCVTQVMLDFNMLTVRDGLDPKEVHREFLKIDEYRHHISPDIEGAALEWDEDYAEEWERDLKRTVRAGMVKEWKGSDL